jgi:glutamate transport system permease protein
VDDVFSSFDLVLRAFWLTLQLLVLSGVASLLLGTLLAALRVGPVKVLNRLGTLYVSVVRNTPLLVMFIFVFIASPTLDLFVGTPFLVKGVIALTIYTSAFVCEAVRSGINSVSLGQAEAARAIGLTFGGTMREVILPQAFRATVPPLASVLIALAKNTSVAAAFGLMEATARMRFFTNNNANDRVLIFLTFAIGYIIIVEVMSAGAYSLERRWRVAR